MCDENDNKDYIGYLSGFILSICLIPQIYKVVKNWCAEDISYLWQFFYFIGLLLNIIYCYFENIIPILIPAILEISLCFTLIILKIYLDFSKNMKNFNNKVVRI